MTFIQAGNGVVFVTGNHDAEFLYPAVRRALAERLERVGTAEQDVSITRTGVNLLRRMEAGRVRFVPWFVREPGGAWIEHGHVFDPACATLSRLSPTRGGTLVQTVAEVATRSFANLMPEMDYHAPDSWTMLDYARWALGRGLRFVVRVVYLYLRMVGRMLGLWAMYGRPDRRGREEHASRLERVAANAGLRMGTLTALARMAPPPAAARIGGVLSVTFMDYVLTCIGAGLLGGALALAPWGTAAIRLPVAVAVGVGLGVLGVRRITRRKRGRDVANDMHDVAGEVAMVTGVPLVLMGHSHHGELSDVGEGIVYGNSGSWLDGFHLVVRRGGDAHLSRVELRRWRNGCVSVEDYRELARGHRGPAAVPEVLQNRTAMRHVTATWVSASGLRPATRATSAFRKFSHTTRPTMRLRSSCSIWRAVRTARVSWLGSKRHVPPASR